MSGDDKLLKVLEATYNKVDYTFREVIKLRNQLMEAMAPLSVALKEYGEAHPPANGREAPDGNTDELDIF